MISFNWSSESCL